MLPAHPKPRTDEVLTSWLARTARLNAISVYSLLRYAGLPHASLVRDVDVYLAEEHLERLSYVTGVSCSLLSRCLLASYDGVMFETRSNFNTMPLFVLPARDKAGRTGFGIQCCPECLEEDGCFRKGWRLAWTVLCLRHDRYLLDRCPWCKGAINNLGSRIWIQTDRVTPNKFWRCFSCDGSYIVGPSKPGAPPEPLIALQRRLDEIVESGYAILEGEAVRAVLFFNGIRRLLRLIATGRQSNRLRDVLRKRLCVESEIDVPLSSKRFEFLPLGERAEVLVLLGYLLHDWPSVFISVCEEAQIFGSRLLQPSALDSKHYRGSTAIPFWCWRQFKRRLDGKRGTPAHRWRGPAEDFITRQVEAGNGKALKLIGDLAAKRRIKLTLSRRNVAKTLRRVFEHGNEQHDPEGSVSFGGDAAERRPSPRRRGRGY